MTDLRLDNLTIENPKRIEDKRVSIIQLPYIQTEYMVYSNEDMNITLACTDLHASKVHEIDDVVCGIISDKSSEWFNQYLTIDQIERMFKPSLNGSRNPKHVVHLKPNTKFFDYELQDDSLPENGYAMFILEAGSIVFEEKQCEIVWNVLQVKQAKPAETHPPMFI